MVWLGRKKKKKEKIQMQNHLGHHYGDDIYHDHHQPQPLSPSINKISPPPTIKNVILFSMILSFKGKNQIKSKTSTPMIMIIMMTKTQGQQQQQILNILIDLWINYYFIFIFKKMEKRHIWNIHRWCYNFFFVELTIHILF